MTILRRNKICTICMSPELWERAREHAELRGISLSALVRELLETRLMQDYNLDKLFAEADKAIKDLEELL